MNEMVRVRGLQYMLRSIAKRMHGDVDGLNVELLEQCAKRLDELEPIAEHAAALVASSGHSKVSARMIVDEAPFQALSAALRRAGCMTHTSRR